MTFHQITYDKARQAIEEGDTSALKRILARPLKRGDRPSKAFRKGLDQITDLMRQASERGQTEAVDHLLGLLPDLEQGGVRAKAWAQAMEHGQPQLAQHLHPAGAAWTWTLYDAAVDENAWHTVLNMLTQGYQPPAAAVSQTLRTLVTRPDQGAHPDVASVMGHLVLVASPEDLVHAARVAMRLGDGGLVDHCLTHVEVTALRQYARDLRTDALEEDRYDWFERVDLQLESQRAMADWMVVLDRALRARRLHFSRDALHHQPALLNHLHQHGEAAVGLVHTLMMATPLDLDGWSDDPLPGEVMRLICQDTYLDWARSNFEDNHASWMPPEMVDGCLNVLAWLVPPVIRDTWVSAEPVRFGPVLALMRSQQAHDQMPTLRGDEPEQSKRRHRPRA